MEKRRFSTARTRAGLAALLAVGSLGLAACLDLSTEGKKGSFACEDCPGGIELFGVPPPDAGTRALEDCDCTLPEARCENGTRHAASSFSCLLDGGCGFEWLEVQCAHGCDEKKLCAGEPCRGVVCNQPPASECTSPTSLRVYGSPGACQGGGCLYVPAEVSCNCANGRCLENPCSGVTCNQPPAPLCVGSTRRSYEAAGVCDGKTGSCVYTPVDTACGAGGCLDGKCLADKCAGVTCNRPPASTCIDSSTVQTFESPGTCNVSTGQCAYVARTVTCTGGKQCSQGACIIPPPACSASNCTGCCNGDTCLGYASQSSSQCGQNGAACGACGTSSPVCQSGTCVNLCAGVSCNSPPANRCADSSTLQQYSPSGSCAPSTGQCSYGSQNVACATGKVCSAGRCACNSSSCPSGYSCSSSGDCVAPGPTWTKRSPSASPGPRRNHAMAYDSKRGRVVLFGGSDGSALQASVWEWDGSNWERKTPTSSSNPKARQDMAMAYDSARARVVLYGGYDGTSYLADTWEWDGAAWSLRQASGPPSGRSDFAMAYDSSRARVVLFGGYNGTSVLGETWEWNGSTWSSRTSTTLPPEREDPAMAFDSARGQVVMFGGYVDGEYLDGTWVWDGTDWALRQPSARPSARDDTAMAFDSARGRVVLFGGGTSAALDGTWEWNGTTWASRTLTGSPPAARQYHAMAYDAARGRVVLYGGGDGTSVLGDTWEYVGD